MIPADPKLLPHLAFKIAVVGAVISCRYNSKYLSFDIKLYFNLESKIQDSLSRTSLVPTTAQ
jgi:hypothetical protein